MCRSEPRAWPWGFDLPRGYTYIHAPHNTRSAVRSRTYITTRREPSRVFPPAWQRHSHDCTVFSQGWRGWVFERKRGWLLRVRWPAVALFWRTRLGVPRTRSKHEFALCETRDRIRAQLVSACFGYVTRVKRVSLSFFSCRLLVAALFRSQRDWQRPVHVERGNRCPTARAFIDDGARARDKTAHHHTIHARTSWRWPSAPAKLQGHG